MHPPKSTLAVLLEWLNALLEYLTALLEYLDLLKTKRAARS